MAETPGTIVACPHCGAHLTVPGAAPAPTVLIEQSTVTASQPGMDSTNISSDAEEQSLAPTSNESPPPSSMPHEEAAEAPPFLDFDDPHPESDGNVSTFPDFSAPASATPSPVTVEPIEPTTNFEPSPAVEAAPAESIAAEVTPAAVAAAPAETPQPISTPQTAESMPEESYGRRSTRPATDGRVSRTVFIIVASYASALTCFLIFLFTNPDRFFKPTAGEMESLPDLPNRGGTILGNGGKLPESSFLLPKQKLKIGGKPRRLGNIEISVIKVVKGPLEILPFSAMIEMGGNKNKVEKTQDVLQLWLKLKNVSTAQKFAPIDFELLRDPQPKDPDLLDTFVAKAGVNVNETPRIPVYLLLKHHKVKGIYEEAEKQLGPGEEYETFVPTEESDFDDLKGQLIWRLRFRKGLSAKGNGVTTLVDVEFDSQQIESSDS